MAAQLSLDIRHCFMAASCTAVDGCFMMSWLVELATCGCGRPLAASHRQLGQGTAAAGQSSDVSSLSHVRFMTAGVPEARHHLGLCVAGDKLTFH